MKPTVRPGLHSYDWRGKFDGDRKTLRHRGRQNDRKEIEKQLDSGEEEPAGVICKAWDGCSHPELCKEECFDKDLVESGEA